MTIKRRIGQGFGFGIGCLLLVACNSGTGIAPADELTAWTRSPNNTSCDQWNHAMTQSQRVQMARDLLPILRHTVDSAASDGAELAPAFVDAITDACASPEVVDLGTDTYVITAAATVAFLSSEFEP